MRERPKGEDQTQLDDSDAECEEAQICVVQFGV
jgi:hypothetical protein